MMNVMTQLDAVLRYFPYGLQRGDEWETDCPNKACPNPKNHFYINLQTFKAHCFRCDISFGGFRSLVNYLSGTPSLYLPPSIPLNGNVEREETIVSTHHFPLTARWYLSRRGVHQQQIKEYNLQNGLGDWTNYVIFTCANTGYQYGRRFKNDSDKVLRYRFPKGIPKKQSVFTHPNFWCENGKPYFSKNAVLVEGAFDAMAVDRWSSDPVSIALMGSSLTKNQELVFRHHLRLLIWLDPDANSKAREIGRKLTAWGLEVRILTLSKEPSDSSKEEIQAVLEQFREK